MRRDLDDLVAAIQKSCRSLFLLNFPTTGWFGDKTVSLVERTLARGVGRLMMTISIDGPKALHEEMRGLPGSWDRGIETFRRLRGIQRSNFQTVIGMTLMEKNADKVDETLAAIRQVIPDFKRSELHLNVGHESGHYFDNVGYPVEQRHAEVLRAIEEHRRAHGPSLHPVRFLEDRYQALVGKYYETQQVAAAVHGAVVVVLHRRVLEPVRVLDLGREGRQPARERVRSAGAVGQRSATRSARGRRRRALLALLDAVRGLSDDSRQPGARRDDPRVERAATSARRNSVGPCQYLYQTHLKHVKKKRPHPCCYTRRRCRMASRQNWLRYFATSAIVGVLTIASTGSVSAQENGKDSSAVADVIKGVIFDPTTLRAGDHQLRRDDEGLEHVPAIFSERLCRTERAIHDDRASRTIARSAIKSGASRS